jgi:hypothetical protein
VAKAAFWVVTDAEVRKRGYRTGLDTLVVHAVNDVDWEAVLRCGFRSKRDKSTAWGVRPQG